MNRFIIIFAALFLFACGDSSDFESPKLGGGIDKQRIDAEGEITKLDIEIVFFDDLRGVRNEWDAIEGYYDPDLEGWSECWRRVEDNEAGCTIYLPRSKYVDDMHILTLGHEVGHGVWGPEYHDE